MAGLGTEVGDAYIEVHADTGPFRRELRAEARLAAQDFGKRFGKSLDKAVDNQLTPLGVRIRQALTEQGRLSGEGFADAMEESVIRAAQRIDDAIVSAATSGDFSGFVGQFKSLDEAAQALNKRLGELRKAEEITLGNSNRITASYRRWVIAINDLTKAEAKANAEKKRQEIQDKANLVLSRVHNAEVKKLTEQSKKLNKVLEVRPVLDLSGEIDQLKRKQFQDKLNAIATRSHDKEVQRLSGSIGTLTNKLKDLDKTPAVDLKDELTALKEFRKAADEAAERVARRFNVTLIGRLKGSRNDFLNMIGSMGKAVEDSFQKVALGSVNLFAKGLADLGTRLLQTEGPLSGFGATLGAMAQRIEGLGAGGVSGLVIQIVALAAAFQGMLLIVGPFAAALSGLAAIVTSLTVTLGGALLGAVVLLGPPIAAAVVGVGALALAFSNLSDEQKEALDPLKELFEETRTAVSDALFANMSDQVQRLADALGPLKGVLTETAAATSQWFTTFLDGLSSGPMAESLNTLGNAIPALFTSLLDLIAGLSGGLLGLFAASSPAAQTFLDKLNGVVDQFTAWVTSAEGSETVNNFLNDALALMSQLWGIAKELGTTLSILWDEGVGSGSTFLRIIQDILADFNEWLGTEEGREALRQWFIDGIALLRDLGDLVGELLRLFDELDNPQTRGAFQFLLDALTSLVGFITLNTQLLNYWRAQAEVAIGAVGRFFSDLGATIAGVWQRAVELGARAVVAVREGWRGGLDLIAGFFAALPGRLVSLLAGLGAAFAQSGGNAMAGLYNGIVAGAARVIAYIVNLGARVAAAFRNALGIASPSKVFADYGMNIAQGLAQGITESIGLVDSAMNNLIDTSTLANLNTPVSNLATQNTAATSGATAGGSVIESGAITVVTPYADPRLVAAEVMDALAVRGK